MITELINSRFARMVYYTHEKYAHVQWHEASAKMTDEEYKDFSLKQVQAIKSTPFNNLLINAEYFDYIISPKMQEWIDNHIMRELINGGLNRMAVILPESLFVQISAEQLFDEDNTASSNLKMKYFSNEQEAKNWLLQTTTV